jgi:hypothetical protein
MSMILLSDDDVALLRWTCELFFVSESPLYFLDAEAREPRDFAQTYHDLVKKGVLDEASFRLTDGALNRLAPLTECDARVVLVLPGDRDRLKTRDFYLQDEIGVEYEEQDQLHAVGQDQDQNELVASLARRFMPRRAAGDYLNLKLEPAEFLALAVLCHHARRGEKVVPMDRVLEELRPGLADGKADRLAQGKRVARDGGKTPTDVPHRAAALLAVAAHDPSPAQDVTARSSQPVARTQDGEVTQVARPRTGSFSRPAPAPTSDEAETIVSDLRARRARAAAAQAGPDPVVAEKALRGLVDKGVAREAEGGLELRPAVVAFALGTSEKGRHTFVRFDFADDEWFIRETSFLAAEGSLFVVAAEEGTGLLHVVELDGRRLEAWLAKAIGPLPELAPDAAPGKSAKDFLLRA